MGKERWQYPLPFENDPLARRWPQESWWLDNTEKLEEREDRVERYLYRLARLEESRAPPVPGIEPAEWWRIGRTEYELDPASRRKIQETCYKLYYKNPFARNIVNNYAFFTLGKTGVRVDWKGDEMANRRWELLCRRNNFDVLAKDLVRMTVLCGEAFVVLFPLEKRLKLDMREVHPTEIEEIETSPEDYSTPLAYVRRSPTGRVFRYSAEDVEHFRMHAVGPVKHGRPVLEPALEALMMYDEWLRARIDLNRMRARLPVIRYVKGKADAPPIRALPEPCTVITANREREEWAFPSLNLNSADAKGDAREIKLYIAAAVSLPEYMVAQEPGAATYAGTTVIEATPLSLFKDLQGMFRGYFLNLIHKLMPQEATRLNPEISFPEVDLRNFSEKVRSIIEEFNAGLRSKRSAQLALELDPAEEERWLKEEMTPLESDPKFRKLIEAAVFLAPALRAAGGGNGNSPIERVYRFLEREGMLRD